VLVVDASVIVDLILDLPPHAVRIAERLRVEPTWAAPHLLDAEVASVLRNRVLRGKLASAGALAALADFLALPVERFPHTALLARAFELRDNASLYDSLYLALAEALDARFLTRDQRLAAVPGLAARVEVIA
jgi:predicted nucleic acid-binding protein